MKTRILYSLLFILITSIFLNLFSACDADTEVDKTVEEILAAQPTIVSVSPESADILTNVTISGTYLNFADKAFIGDVECQITQRINGSTLQIEVAPQASTGIVKIITSAGKEAVSPSELTVTYPTPNVTSTFPSSATVNENITLEGNNLESITRISFGDMDGIIQFQEDQALVVSVPNNENSPVEVNYYYNSSSGEVTEQLSSSFNILIPTPIISNWPSLMSRDNEVTIVGTDMNLITGVSVGGEDVTLNTASATSVSFNVPSGVVTGYQDIVINYGTAGEITQADVPYINGQFESYIEFDSYSEDVFVIDFSKDPLATQQLNGTVEQPPFPGTSYYNLNMNTGTGSTIARMRLHNETVNDTWPNMIDAGNFGSNPVLHFWMNTEGTEPIFKIYIGGTSSANRRQLSGSDTNTGNGWQLFAVRLNGFIPSISSVGSTFEFRFNTGSGATDFPIKVNLDWIIVTDSVLTEFGAIDVTDQFGSAG
ncbi:IPT/TIG domain-containing protein [Bizionia sp.]|uniref:IPT/TIG domain-containing protein n=1 Tax=Bizionia sp. TaxID=1954480 RepID=UPI003A929CA6